ncbi:unnamed protein product [Trichogramma brassicae]|uniref:Uncharacterized protein n=1 Tax=Trichogramma brassicae TaxID=86971 RepID=A0A6H5J1G6_9HYME|nr:unnamed protein product [Trichogramma brassicae]
MLSLLRLYSNMLLLGSTALTVMLDPNQAKAAADSRQEPSQTSSQSEPPLPPIIDQDHQQQKQPHTFNDALQVCFSKRQHSTLECLNRGALTAIESWNDDQCLDFGNVQLLKAENQGEGRAANLLDLDWDPKDFGNVLRAASRMLERRNVKWDLGYIYPGLQMRVGPTLSTENGVLEFVMDERLGHHHYHNRQLGSAAAATTATASRVTCATTAVPTAVNEVKFKAKVADPTRSVRPRREGHAVAAAAAAAPLTAAPSNTL